MKEQTLSGPMPARKLHPATLLPWAAPLLLWSGILLCLASGNHYDQQIVTAFALLTVASVITYFRTEAGVLLTLPVIIAGVLGLAVFFPLQITAGFELGLFNLTFDLLLILIAAVHFLTNRRTFLPIRTEPTARQRARAQRQAVATYKAQFAHMDLPELEYIAGDHRFVPAAMEAARELIKELENED